MLTRSSRQTLLLAHNELNFDKTAIYTLAIVRKKALPILGSHFMLFLEALYYLRTLTITFMVKLLLLLFLYW